MPLTPPDPVDAHDPAFWQPLHQLAAWARETANAQNLADVLSLNPALPPLPEDIAEAWDQLANTAIHPVPGLVGEPAQRIEVQLIAAIEAADGALSRLSPRGSHAFRSRVLGMPDDTPEPAQTGSRNRPSKLGPTLQALGDHYGVTRERIRQIEAKAIRRVDRALREDLQIGSFPTAIQQALGAAFPLDALHTVPELSLMLEYIHASEFDRDEAPIRTLVWFAGYEFTKEGWAIQAGSETSEESALQSLVDLVSDDGALHRDEARDTLLGMGLVPLVADRLLETDPPGTRLFEESYLPWGSSQTDKAETILRWLHRPATAEELLEFVGLDKSALRSFANRLADTPRFMRTGKSTYGLREWDMEEYSGIPNEIAERIERAGRPLPLTQLIDEISTSFGVRSGSVQAYAYAPRFVVEDGIVRLRREDEPFPVPATHPEDDPSIQRTPNGRYRYSIAVTEDTLRGSGRTFSDALAHALGISPGDKTAFHSPLDIDIRISWPINSMMGPNLGSVRLIAESLGARLGDTLVLEFDPASDVVRPFLNP